MNWVILQKVFYTCYVNSGLEYEIKVYGRKGPNHIIIYLNFSIKARGIA